MKRSSILVLSSLLASALSIPFLKRDIIVEVVTQEVIETDYVVTTVWVAAGEASSTAATLTSVGQSAYVVQSSASTPSSTLVSTSAASSYSPALAVYSSVAPLSTSISIAPSSTSTYSPPTTAQAPVSSAAMYMPPASSSAPAPSSIVASSAGSGSSLGTLTGASYPADCSASGPCTGDITYYTPGLGACGNSNSDSEMVLAVSVAMMGTLSSGDTPNPMCGKKVSLKNGDNSATATVVDKCAGCNNATDVDLSSTLFKALSGGSLDAGRIHGVQWWFTD